MARYIDADKLIKSLELSIQSWSGDCNSNAPTMVRVYQDVVYRVKNIPTADVVPKSEVESLKDLNKQLEIDNFNANMNLDLAQQELDKLEYTLAGVMHSVDKWLDGEELEQDEVNRAITMREKTLRIIEDAKSEVERLRFNLEAVLEEIPETKREVAREIIADMRKQIQGYENIDIILDRIEKKYTESEGKE